MEKHYAGVGVRESTRDQLNKCYQVGSYLAHRGWTLHTGLDEGADRSFCLGALENGGVVVLHRPFLDYATHWLETAQGRFQGQVELQQLDPDDQQAFQVVLQYHPAAKQLTKKGLLFHACNYRMRVPVTGPPALFTVALQGPRPQEQEFGYRLGTGLSIPSLLLLDLDLDEIKVQLDLLIEQQQPPEVTATLECWVKSEQVENPSRTTQQTQRDPTYLLPATHATVQELLQQIEELKNKFRARERAACPCCGQSVNLRRTTVNSDMAKWLISLIRIYLANGRDWITRRDHRELLTTGGDYSKPKYWGLIEQRSIVEAGQARGPTERGSGVWRPTQKGIDYALGQIKIPSYCLTYNDQVYSFSSTEVSISEAFHDSTEYARLVDGLDKLAYPEG